MKITTLWQHELSDEMPWLVTAYDEYTEEEHNGEPEFYTKEKQSNPERRELVIVIPDEAVEKLFQAPEVKGKVVEKT